MSREEVAAAAWGQPFWRDDDAIRKTGTFNRYRRRRITGHDTGINFIEVIKDCATKRTLVLRRLEQKGHAVDTTSLVAAGFELRVRGFCAADPALIHAGGRRVGDRGLSRRAGAPNGG